MNFYVKKLEVDKVARVVYYLDGGDNFWYDMPYPFDDYHYFWHDNSEGYAKLYFIDKAPLYGPRAPSWVKKKADGSKL